MNCGVTNLALFPMDAKHLLIALCSACTMIYNFDLINNCKHLIEDLQAMKSHFLCASAYVDVVELERIAGSVLQMTMQAHMSFYSVMMPLNFKYTQENSSPPNKITARKVPHIGRPLCCSVQATILHIESMKIALLNVRIAHSKRFAYQFVC